MIERSYPLEQVQDAVRYLAEGHALWKFVITAWLHPSEAESGLAG